MSNQLTQLALHEAGHCIAAIDFGSRIIHTTISHTGSGCVHADTDPYWRPAIVLAGEAFSGLKSDDDHNTVRNCALAISASERDAWFAKQVEALQAWARTPGTLDAVVLIAGHLLQRVTLSGAEIADILGAALPARFPQFARR